MPRLRQDGHEIAGCQPLATVPVSLPGMLARGAGSAGRWISADMDDRAVFSVKMETGEVDTGDQRQHAES